VRRQAGERCLLGVLLQRRFLRGEVDRPVDVRLRGVTLFTGESGAPSVTLNRRKRSKYV
jgi:hypothetical protein